MSRANYSDDLDQWTLIRWRGAVASAIRGKRGQAFLREMLAALDALPERRLIAHDLKNGDSVCAIGSVGLMRGLDMTNIDPEDPEQLVKAFGVPDALVREIEYLNDDDWPLNQSPEARYERMRKWVQEQIKETP